MIGKIALAVVLVGLALTGVGAFIAARAVILDESQADAISGTHWDRNQAFKSSLLSQSRSARNGLWLVVTGTALQMVGTITQAFAN